MSQPVEVPVLIVGAGPAGLTAAITLAQHGVDVLVVERRLELSGLPRATAISTRRSSSRLQSTSSRSTNRAAKGTRKKPRFSIALATSSE